MSDMINVYEHEQVKEALENMTLIPMGWSSSPGVWGLFYNEGHWSFLIQSPYKPICIVGSLRIYPFRKPLAERKEGVSEDDHPRQIEARYKDWVRSNDIDNLSKTLQEALLTKSLPLSVDLTQTPEDTGDGS